MSAGTPPHGACTPVEAWSYSAQLAATAVVRIAHVTPRAMRARRPEPGSRGSSRDAAPPARKAISSLACDMVPSLLLRVACTSCALNSCPRPSLAA